MDKRQLLALAVANAKNQSVERPNEKIYLFFDGESEFTTAIGEKGKDTVLAVEPNLTLVATFLNGDVI